MYIVITWTRVIWGEERHTEMRGKRKRRGRSNPRAIFEQLINLGGGFIGRNHL
jgi:hypothetical protein